MSNRKIKSQEKLPFKNNDSYTLNQSFGQRIDSVGKENELGNIYQAIMSINNRLDDLEKKNIQLQKELRETKTRENKLLNRFSWLIQIINISSVILMIMAVILFIDSFYPFIQKLMKDSLGATIVMGAIGSAIGAGIIGIWLSFNKYVREVIERERKQ